MAAVITIYDDLLATRNRHVRVQAVSGTAVTGATLLIDDTPTGGQALANESLVTMNFVSGEWHVLVQPTVGISYSVVVPDAIESDEGTIVEGVQLLFGTLDTGTEYVFNVIVGYHAGLLVAGSTSAPKQLFAKNTGSTDGIDALVLIRPDAHFTNVTGELLNGVGEVDMTLIARVGTYTVTLIDDDPYTVEATIDGMSVMTSILADPDAAAVIPNGPALYFSPLTGVSIGDESTVKVSSGFLQMKLAEDVAGVPGDFESTDLELGSLDVDEVKAFWLRIESAASSSALDNPFSAQLQGRITSV